MNNFFLYLVVMAGVTYLIRAIPILLIKKKIKNRFFVSFLNYIPYSVLSVMTIPACFYATGNIISAVVGFFTAVFISNKSKNLILVAVGASLATLLTEIIMQGI